MDRTGLYGLFALDGAPPDPAASAILGLTPQEEGVDHVAGAIDLADPGAAQCARSGAALTLLLGRLDDPDAVAARLGMATDAPQAVLAAATLDRFGPAVRTLLEGEWTLVRWDARALVLVASLCQRDPLFYAVRGNRVAIGSDLRQLSRISWVGDVFDPAGLLMALGRFDLRAPGDTRTPVAGIASVSPGGFVTIDREGVRKAEPAAMPVAAEWHGDLDLAMGQAAALMRRIVRQRMIGGSYACMLSGGLDSSTLAWAIAAELHPGEQLRYLTSAARPGSEQIDEMAEAAIVAAHLRITHDPVIAASLPGPYRPDPSLFRDANGPTLDVRHYLYHAFAAQSRAGGAALLFDGQFGEITFTNSMPLYAPPSPLRIAREWLRRSPSHRTEAFHVHLAADRLTALPDPLRAALHRPVQLTPLPGSGKPWGIHSGFAKAARAPASLDLGRVRVAMPFRDPRLIALFARFPAAMLYPQPGDRTPARRLLSGKLPDAIRLRGKGPGFAPDYVDRLQSEAQAARARIALFRRAEADEWINLDALDHGLARAGIGATASYADATRTQLTALAGEFIAWWRGVS